MLKIDIVKRKTNDGYYSKAGHVIVNSIEDTDSYFYELKDGENSVNLYNEEAINELLNYSFNEVGVFFHKFSYDIEVEDWDFWLDMNYICKSQSGITAPSIEVAFRVETEEWNSPYSLLEFSKALSEIIELENDPAIKYYQSDEEFVSNGFGILFNLTNGDAKILKEEEKVVEKVETYLSRTKAVLIDRIESDVVTTLFSFPEEIKTACNQYLVYFAQFLRDTGIEVETEIKDEAHKTLFRVIPKSKDESLDNIRAALNVYLKATEFDDFGSYTGANNDISVMQWQANILHLKSQLTLANSILQLKEATIQSLQLSNFQLNELLDKNENASESEEDLIKGIISVKKYEAKGFTVNLAEILRRLKRTLK